MISYWEFTQMEAKICWRSAQTSVAEFIMAIHPWTVVPPFHLFFIGSWARGTLVYTICMSQSKPNGQEHFICIRFIVWCWLHCETRSMAWDVQDVGSNSLLWLVLYMSHWIQWNPCLQNGGTCQTPLCMEGSYIQLQTHTCYLSYCTFLSPGLNGKFNLRDVISMNYVWLQKILVHHTRNQIYWIDSNCLMLSVVRSRSVLGEVAWKNGQLKIKLPDVLAMNVETPILATSHLLAVGLQELQMTHYQCFINDMVETLRCWETWDHVWEDWRSYHSGVVVRSVMMCTTEKHYCMVLNVMNVHRQCLSAEWGNGVQEHREESA